MTEQGIAKVGGGALTVPESVPVKRSVLVLGAGMSGGTIARTLARFGLEVVLVDKETPLAEAGFDEWRGVELLTGAQLIALEGNFGDFRATIETRGEVIRWETGAVVVAVGLERKQPSKLPLAATLRDFRRRVEEGEGFRRVCFLMDLEQSTPLGEFRLGLESALEAAQGGSKVSFLCQEVKVGEEGLERLYRSAREEGVLFVNYQDRPVVSPLGQEVSVQVTDLAPGAASHLSGLCISADVIVVPDNLLPNEGNPRLAGLLRTDLDEEGYFQLPNVRLHLGRTNRRGIFVVGDCREPSTPRAAVEEGEATAQEIASLLARGEVRIDWPVAVVDPEKCAFCLTCNRICPHQAAGMDLEEESALIYPSDCYGCGVCVAECPSAAITMERYADSDLVEALMR